MVTSINTNGYQRDTGKEPSIPPELCKKLISKHGCEKRIPNETAEAVSEVLRMFIIEARARASIEAECDLEGGMEDGVNDENAAGHLVSIRADHITKIAGEMLMDFS